MITVIMGITFLGLLSIQIFYMRNIIDIHKQQFSQGVRSSLFATARYLEQEEASYYLEDRLSNVQTQSIYSQRLGALPAQEGVKLSFMTTSGLMADLTIKGDASEVSNIQGNAIFLGGHYKSQREAYRHHYLYQKGVLDDVILNIMQSAADRPISERADSAVLCEYLRARLDTVGIEIPFEFGVVNSAGLVQYKSDKFNPNETKNEVFTQSLFPLGNSGGRYYLKVYFPGTSDYLFGTATYMIPALVFTIILLLVFVFTIVTAFRQKRLDEMKADFINNMTHEFKTPLSSLSLAGQMLKDPDIRKSQPMLEQISQVIRDETKRLRIQVDKVLQLSVFDSNQFTFKFVDIDANALIFSVINILKLRVERYGGKITADLDAMDAIVEVDELHFTNVIFNLLDNAIKYRSEDRPLDLRISSRDIDGDRLEIVISDNGIGLHRDDLKKIFEKFYRVPTGNLHNVKGFGLGLTYVKDVIRKFGGTINVESEINIGTKFIIILPLSKD